MFTGIVTHTARIHSWETISGGRRVRLAEIRAGDDLGDEPTVEVWNDLEVGESIAVDGCCLTLVGAGGGTMAFDLVTETLRRTALADLEVGGLVNLERSLRVGDRLGGHYVTGHVDGIGRLVSLDREGEDTRLVVAVEEGDGFRVIPKGSVTVDGISLTVVDCDSRRFSVALIPHTMVVTALRERGVGDRVNLETDPIGKWVEHLMHFHREERP